MTGPSKTEYRRHHRRARTASIAEYEILGAEHAKEDALACSVGLTLSDPATVHALQRQRMSERRRRLTEAGVSDDRIAAWLGAHTITIAQRMAEISQRAPCGSHAIMSSIP